VQELIVVLGSVVLVTARWLPAAARRRTAVGAAAVVLIGAATLLPEPRWQMLPVLAADLLVGLGLLFARRRARRWVALPATLACLVLVAGGGVAAWALPVPVFPSPSGPSPVGTTVEQWTDPGREEPGTPRADDFRTVVVQFWYPARETGSRARYLGRTRQEAETVAAGEASYLGVPAAALAALPRAHSHATPGAAPADGRFPVVLFSPGLGGVRGQNTAWAEDLASRGYLVAGVDHPFDSAAVVLADGSTVRSAITAGGDRAENDRRRARWTDVRAEDLRFVLSRLAAPGSGPLAGSADTGRVAATGHSIGGAAAMRAAELDPRVTAVVNLDGGLNPGQGPVRQPVLALTHEITDEAGEVYVARLSSVLDRGGATSYRLTVPGSAHLTFTDAPLFLPPVPSITGSLGGAGSVRVTAQTTAAFLDATLRGRPAGLPAELARHGDLHVHSPAD
jgi:predicted dienelactone hydrolase